MMKKLILLPLILLFLISSASAYTYTVKKDGTGNFDCLAACLDFTENTDNECEIYGTWKIENCTNANVSNLKIQGADYIESSMLRSGEADGGSCTFPATKNLDFLIGDDFPTVCDAQRLVMRILNSTLDKAIFSGTFNITGLWLYVNTKRDLSGTNTQMFRRVNTSWEAGDTSWNYTDYSELEKWTNPGANESPDILENDDINFTYLTSIVTNRFHYMGNSTTSPSVWLEWFQEWANGIVSNNGFWIALLGDNAGGSSREYLIFEGPAGGTANNYPYFNMTSATFNVTVKTQYNFTHTAISFGDGNSSLDCNNVKLYGDGGGDGIEAFRIGDNITIKNCIIENFDRGIDIDAYITGSDGYENYTVINITTIGGRCLNAINLNSGTGWYNFTDITCNQTGDAGAENYGLIISQSTSQQGVTARDINMLDCTADVACIWFTTRDSTIDNIVLNVQGAGYGIGTRANNATFTNIIINAGGNNGFEFQNSGESSTLQDSTIHNCSTCIGNDGSSSLYLETIRRNNIYNGVIGIDTNYMNWFIHNNNVTNMSLEGIYLEEGAIGNAYGEVINNTIINAGNTSITNQFLISLFRAVYSGFTFDQSTPLALDNALGGAVGVSADDTDVSTIFTGANDGDLWAIDLPLAALPFLTAYVEDGSIGCFAAAAAFGGTCYLDSDKYYTGNGNANYTIATVPGLTVKPGDTDPPYLRYNVIETQDNYPFYVVADGNNNVTVEGNVVYNNDGRTTYEQAYFDFDDTSSGRISQIHLNHFDIDAPITISGTAGTDYSVCKYLESGYWPTQSDNLLAAWTFNNDSKSFSNLTFTQEYNNLLNGTMNSTSYNLYQGYQYNGSAVSGAYSYDGVCNRAQIDNDTTTDVANLPDGFTLSAWIYREGEVKDVDGTPLTVPGISLVAGRGDTQTDNLTDFGRISYGFFVSNDEFLNIDDLNNQPGMVVSNGTHLYVVGSTLAEHNINLSTWYFLTMTINASNFMTFYVNGVKASNGGLVISNSTLDVQLNPEYSPNLTSTPNGSFFIGAMDSTFASNITGGDTGYFGFDGVIDQVEFHNKSLNATEILGLYNSYSVGPKGNYYQENATEITGDCGNLDLIGATTYRQTITMFYKNASHAPRLPLTYYGKADNVLISALSSTNTYVVPVGTVNVTLIPHDGYVYGKPDSLTLAITPYLEAYIDLYNNSEVDLYPTGSVDNRE